MKKEPLYIFVHIPKTGGSTIRKHIEKNVTKDERLFLSFSELRFDPYTLTYDKLLKCTKRKIQKIPQEEKKKIKVVYGEEVPFGVHKFFKREPRYISVIRDPNERAKSLYNFYRTRYEKDSGAGVHRSHYDYQLLINGKVHSFAKWLKEKYAVKENSTESMLQLFQTLGFIKDERVTKTKIEKCLNKFFFLGLTEESEKDFPYIYSLLGFNKFFIRQNVSKKFVEKFNKNVRKILNSKNRVDYLLYGNAKLYRERFVKERNDYVKRVKGVKRKQIMTPITQVLFDFKNTLIFISQIFRRRSKLYSLILDEFKNGL